LLHQIPIERQRYALERLRAARASILADAEDFAVAVDVLKEVQQILMFHSSSLPLDATPAEMTLTFCHTQSDYADHFYALAQRLEDIHEHAVRVGPWARKLSRQYVELFLYIEKALTVSMSVVSELMVKNPVTVEPWQSVEVARRLMLNHAFTSIPVYINHSWYLIDDHNIARYLAPGSSPRRDQDLRTASIHQAINNGLTLSPATCITGRQIVRQFAETMPASLVLVTERRKDREYLLGVISASDVL